VFAQDEEQTLDRVAEETGSEAILIPNPAARVERLLVPHRGEVDVARVTSFVASMVGERPLDITLYHVSETKDDRTAGQSMVDAARDRLMADRIDPDAIDSEVAVSTAPIRAIAEMAADQCPYSIWGSLPFPDEMYEQVEEESAGPTEQF
jgi:hypothetical protein